MGKKKVYTEQELVEIENKSTAHFMGHTTGTGQTDEVLKRQHEQVQRDIEALPEAKRKQVKETQALVQAAMEEQNDLLFSEEAFASDRRIKESRDLEEYARRYKMGQIFNYGKSLKVKTPYGNVIDAQAYVDVLQDQVIGTAN